MHSWHVRDGTVLHWQSHNRNSAYAAFLAELTAILFHVIHGVLQLPGVWQYLGKLHSLNRFSYGTDLIDFQQQGSAGLLPYCALDSSWIGTQKIITNHLHAMMLLPSATQSQEQLQSTLIIQTAYVGDTLPYLRRLHCLIHYFTCKPPHHSPGSPPTR